MKVAEVQWDLVLRRRNISRDLCLIGRGAFGSSRSTSMEVERRQECRRGTQECVSHIQHGLGMNVLHRLMTLHPLFQRY